MAREGCLAQQPCKEGREVSPNHRGNMCFRGSSNSWPEKQKVVQLVLGGNLRHRKFVWFLPFLDRKFVVHVGVKGLQVGLVCSPVLKHKDSFMLS